ncbi:MAG: YHS domain-containing (seleno)protein [Pseudomonadales bacterium]
MKLILKALLFSTLMVSLVAASAKENVPAHDSKICSPDGIAVGGYDLVSYHTENMAVKGRAEWSVDHGGLSHLFSSEANLRLFTASPKKYLPKFSGWCATALANNKLTCPE